MELGARNKSSAETGAAFTVPFAANDIHPDATSKEMILQMLRLVMKNINLSSGLFGQTMLRSSRYGRPPRQ
jgi:hypothetical protein